jgi:acetyl esterase
MTQVVQLDPQALAFAQTAAHPPFPFNLPLHAGRAALDQLQSSPIDKPAVDIQDITATGGPGGGVSVRILRPPNASHPLPVIIYIHGAGWVFGGHHTHDRLIRLLAVGANAAVVFPNYSLSPEARYPTAIEECYAALRWVAVHGAEHGLDTDCIAAAGDSVGGNMTAALTLLAKERGGPCITRQLLFYPVTNADFDTASYHQFAEGYGLRRDAMMWFWDQYTTNLDERHSITASPLRASIEQLRGLPPALVITAQADVLRDEGEAYASKLSQAGVDVTAVCFRGMIHDFVMLNALAHTTATTDALSLAVSWLRSGLFAR